MSGDLMKAPGVADTAIEVLGVPVVEKPPVLDTNYRKVIRQGWWILVVGLVGFLLWAAWAPLDEGVPAPGVVSVESSRKKVEHLQGGIVREILVREGQTVQQGQALLVLDETQSKAALEAVRGQRNSSLAALARLQAEREGRTGIVFPQELLARQSDPNVAVLLRTQTELFRARRGALLGELRIISESVKGLEDQLFSLSELKANRARQTSLFKEQIANFENLRREGFVSRNNVLELERQLADVQSQASEDMANIAATSAKLVEFRMRGAQREVEYRREVESLLSDVQKELATQSEQLVAQTDSVTRLVLRAPVSGAVVDLAVHTVGGVIKPADRLMDIVPAADFLVVEGKVSPQYIDRLTPGMLADVHFDAYASRMAQPVVQGKLAVVSADALSDARTGSTFYTIRVTVPDQEVRKLGQMHMHPGMVATVMIKTGERSLLAYLLRPLSKRLSTALTEH